MPGPSVPGALSRHPMCDRIDLTRPPLRLHCCGMHSLNKKGNRRLRFPMSSRLVVVAPPPEPRQIPGRAGGGSMPRTTNSMNSERLLTPLRSRTRMLTVYVCGAWIPSGEGLLSFAGTW